MKPIFLILLLCCFGNAYSQIQIGARAGVHGSAFINRTYNTNGMGYGPSFSTKAIKSYHAGLFAEIPISKSFSVVPEVRYIKRGSAADESSMEVRLTHLEVPLSGLYHVNKLLSVEGGLVYSRTLAGTIGGWEAEDTFRPNTFGAQAGVNLHFTKRIALSALYYRAMNAVLVQTYFTTDHQVLADDRYYNGSVHLSLRYSVVSL